MCTARLRHICESPDPGQGSDHASSREECVSSINCTSFHHVPPDLDFSAVSVQRGMARRQLLDARSVPHWMWRALAQAGMPLANNHTPLSNPAGTMSMISLGASLLPTVRSVLRIDWTQVSYLIALRNTVGVVMPLAVGAATGQLLAGLTVSLGALSGRLSRRRGAVPRAGSAHAGGGRVQRGLRVYRQHDRRGAGPGRPLRRPVGLLGRAPGRARTGNDANRPVAVLCS